MSQGTNMVRSSTIWSNTRALGLPHMAKQTHPRDLGREDKYVHGLDSKAKGYRGR